MRTLIFGGGDIAQGLGGVIVPHQMCDVRDEVAVDAHIDFHQPEVVINCAAVSYPARIADDPPRWSEEIGVNLTGSYIVARCAIRHHVKTMIFLASVSGLYGKANHAGYCASKAGVISLVQSLAAEGHNAYAVSPGRVDTKLRTRLNPDEDPATRLTVAQVAGVVEDILAGKYQPGDNVVIRREGEDTIIEVDQGEPWKGRLQ